jgi:hypothetical protein
VLLVDWEFARAMPVAVDPSKPLLQARSPADALEAVRAPLTATLEGHGTYTLEEQLALAHVQMLSWSARRREKAEAAGRSRQFERDTSRRIAAVAAFLEVDLI